MNKQEFLNQLKSELNGLSSIEVDDIIRDQDEYFREAMGSGRDESQVVSSLGSPAKLAKELKAEYQIRVAGEETEVLPKTKNIFKAVLALCVLAPFNLLIVLGPFLTLIGILLSIWIVDIVSIAGSIAIIVVGFVAMVAVNPMVGVTLFFGGITLLGASILFFFAMIYFTTWLLKMTVSFLKWNINFVTEQAKS